MRARLDAGTDVAMIGAWDAHRDAEPFAENMFREVHALLESEAANGDLLLIHTGADGGGPVDVFVDEPIPPEELARLQPIEGLRRLSVPSGVLRIGGAEYYRVPKPMARPGVVTIPSGDYAMSVFVPLDEEAEPPSEAALRKRVGADELRRYDRINQGIVYGAFAAFVLALVGLAPFIGRLAFVAAVVVLLAWFPVANWLTHRSRSYMRLHEIAVDFRLRQASPSLVLTLRRLRPGETLAGGSVSFPQLTPA